MSDEIIKVNVRGIAELQAFFAEMPRGSIRTAIEAASVYIIGDSNHGLKYQPRRVMHDASNPYQWQSEKQRRAFFATKGFGRGIPTRRTGQLANGWGYKATNNGYRMRLINTTKYSPFVQGDYQQRGHAADKWRKYGAIISDNMRGAMQAANRAVEKWLKQKAPK